MKLPYFIFLVLVGFLVPALSFMILRVVLKKPPYKFKIIFRSPGVDKHEITYGDVLSFKHKIKNKTYMIKAHRLYRYKTRGLRKIIYKFRGIKESFFIVFQHGKTEPLAPADVKISARVIKQVSESRALGKAFKSEFSVPWDLKKILMVIGFLVVAVIIYVVISGDVAI